MRQFAYLRSLKPWARRKKLVEFGNRTGFLYKFIDFDISAAFSIQKARDLIVEGSLYLTKPSQFNDPDEFRVNLRVTADPVRRRKWAHDSAKRSLARFLDTLPGVFGRGRKIEILVTRAIERLRKNPDLMFESYQHHVDTYGVCCFSKNPRNMLMWAHYARGHRGICVQFDSSKCPVFSATHDVSYGENVPSLTWPDDKDRVLDPLMSKSFDWGYEDERRYISSHVAGGSLAFDANAVSGVIVGRRFRETPNAAAELIKLLDERHARGLDALRLFEATRSTTYDLKLRKTSAELLLQPLESL